MKNIQTLFHINRKNEIKLITLYLFHDGDVNMKNIAGEFRKNLAGELQCKSFLPSPLPPKPPFIIDEEIGSLLSKTNRTIGILKGYKDRSQTLKYVCPCM